MPQRMTFSDGRLPGHGIERDAAAAAAEVGDFGERAYAQEPAAIFHSGAHFGQAMLTEE